MIFIDSECVKLERLCVLIVIPKEKLTFRMQNKFLKFEFICEGSIEKLKDGSGILAFAVAADHDKNNKIIFSSTNGYLFIGDILGTKKLITIKFDQPVQCITCNNTGDMFMISQNNREISIYDIEKIYSMTKSTDINNYQDFNAAKLFSYKHSYDVLYSAINPELTRKDKISFAFADSAGNVYSYFQQLFLGGATNISSNETEITNLKWKYNYILWSTSSSIYAYDISSKTTKEKLCIHKSNTKGQTCFAFMDQKNLCSSFGSFFLQTNFDPFNTIIINTGYQILSMDISSVSTVQIIKKDETPIIVIDSPTFYSEENFPIESIDLTCVPIIVNTVNPNMFVCAASARIFTVNILSWSERLSNAKSTQEDFINICDQLRALLPTLNDDERLEIVITTVCHYLQFNSVEIDKAIFVCKEFLRPEEREWARAMEEFERDSFGRLTFLTPFIPVEILRENTPRVTDILLSLLDESKIEKMKRFFEVFKVLLCGDIAEKVFAKMEKIDILIQALETNANTCDPIFNIPLVYIHKLQGQHENALMCAIAGGYTDFLNYVKNFSMWKFCLLNMRTIFLVYGESIIDFLLEEKTHFAPVDVIQSILSKRSETGTNEFLYRYMQALRSKGIPIPERFNNLLITLYLQHRSRESLDILKSCTFDNILKIKEGAHSNMMFREEAYILMKGGSFVEGLRIHMEFIKEPKEAVDYAIRCGEQVVWDELLKRSQVEPFRTYMLGNLQDLSNYLTFFDKIRDELDDNAWKAVQNRLNEFKRQNNIMQNIDNIVSEAAFNRYNNQLKKIRRGKRINPV